MRELVSCLTGSDWFDLWHTHFDSRGEGNHDPEKRRRYLGMLFAAWEQVEQFARGRRGPWQSWLVIDTADSGQDAVYFHTPNPNRDNFPYAFEGVIWSVVPPAYLAKFIDSHMQVGRSESNGIALYWIRKQQPLEREEA